MNRSPDGARASLRVSGPILVLLILVVAARFWVAWTAPVIGQEAYHWEYATHPDFSYFDHPPLIGWAIAAGAALLGDGPLGIRMFSLVFALVTTWIGLAFVRDLGGDERAQRMWIVSTLALPILGFGMNLALTEGPLMCGWMLAMWGLWRARDGSLRWWLVTGLGVGLALLSKYTTVFLLAGVAGLCVVTPQLRRQLRRPAPWLGLLLTSVAFTPVVYWNARHGWASFLYQATSHYDSTRVSPLGLFESLGGQLVVLTPMIAFILGASTVWWLRRWRSDPRSLWVVAFGLPLPLSMGIQSVWVTVKLNWMAPAYLILVIGLAVWASECEIWTRFPRRAAAARLTAGASLLLFVASPAAALLPSAWGNGWSGWDVVASHAEQWEERLDADGAEENGVFFFSLGPNETAALEYWLRRLHTEPSPLEPVLPDSVLGGRGLAFDYWTSPSKLAGQDAIAVVTRSREGDERAFLTELRKHFGSVVRAEEIDVRELGIVVRQATVWICRDYIAPNASDSAPPSRG